MSHQIEPFAIFNGAFACLFGLMIIGAQFELEVILKEVAFMKRYWGKGIFFMYLGIPLLKLCV
eukprot:SAG31_NODE_6238_length_2107_cov_1.871016_1_plen_63_part_00